ncbi:MAG: hypothetical protein OHK0022_10760 [Roseiflexaceae bacterium]
MSTIVVDLALGRDSGSGYTADLRVTITGSSAPVTPLAAPARLSFDPARLRALALDPAAYGSALGGMLFASHDLRAGLVQARAVAGVQGLPLRLRLAISPDAAELHGLRWECLTDPDAPDLPLAASAMVLLSRTLPSADWQPVAQRPSGPLGALALVAAPSDLAGYGLAPLDAAQEAAHLRAQLGGCTLTLLGLGERASLGALLPHLHKGCDLLCVLAHGRADEQGQTWLYLEDAAGRTAPLAGQELVAQVAALAAKPRLVILGCCESAGDGTGAALAALGPQLVRAGVPAVLAMQGRISRETLGRFLPACLRLLQQDGQIDRAVAVARGQVRDRPDWWVPALWMRPSDGSLWQPAAQVVSEPALTSGQRDELLARLALSIQVAAPPAPDAAPDAYAQYRAYLLRLLPPLDPQAAPYLGLQTFQTEHADRFFGRDRLIAELAERLGRAPFLAVLGASGSGKSSVVRAGLLPLLKAGGLPGSEGWQYVVLRPGAQPLDALVAALSTARGSTMSEALDLAARLATNEGALLLIARIFAPRLVLVVDQTEELWTLQPTRPEQRAAWQEQQQRPFLRLLLSALDAPDRPVLVILTMRADFLHRAIEQAAFARAVTEHLVPVSPMAAEELRAAITMPAQQSGGSFEPGLVDELIAQTQGEGGGLPLLEYTLQELWARRQPDGLMTWASYRALGGVEGALAKRADALLVQHHSPPEQEELRRLLLRLIQPGEGMADTRRRMTLADLAAAGQNPHEVQALLQPLIDARLVTSGQAPGQQPVVEVSHEALIRSWPTLRGWIDEARADLRLQIQLEEAAREWQESGEDASLLWDGLRLSNAETWLQRARPRLGERDAAFLEASRAEARRRAEAATQAERDRLSLAAEQRNARRLRRLLALAGLLLVVAVVAIVAAVLGQRQTEQARSLADSASKTAVAASALADAQRLAYAAQSERDAAPEVALLLAGEAATRVENPITEQALRDALDHYPFRSRILSGHSAPVAGAAFSPDGARVVTASDDGTARVWSSDGVLVATFQGHSEAVASAAFSPDGSQIVTASDDRTARLWSADGQALAVLKGHGDWVKRVAFSPDGARIVTASDDGTARVWSSDGKELAVLQGHTSAVLSALFSPDGQQIVTASSDGTARLWGADGEQQVVLRGHGGSLTSAAFSPDGERIITSAQDRTARVWSSDGDLLTTLQGHSAAVVSAAFSPDGEQIVTASDDGTAQVWSADGEPLAVLEGHSAGVVSVAFSPDGQQIVTASSDGTAWLWTAEGEELALLGGHSAAVVSAAFSPDGEQIVTASDDGTARLWSRDAAGVVALQEHEQEVWSAAFSPDGAQIVTGSQDGMARVWSADGALQTILQGHTSAVLDARFSPDGTRIVTASRDNTVRVWSVGGELLATLQGHSSAIVKAQFSPDGTRILTASLDGTARVWSADGQLQATLQGHTASVWGAQFSPDGAQIVTASEDGTARVWSVAGATLATLQGHTRPVYVVQFSPDGTRIVTASRDDTARVWSLDGTLLAVLRGHTISLSNARFSPDGSRIVTTALDHTARLWSSDGSLLTTLQGHTDWVWDAQFSPDGSLIVTAGGDGTARLWSGDGKPLAVLRGHSDFLESATFSPDGTRILTASEDATARVYPVRLRDLLAVAACRLPRNLAPEERVRFQTGDARFDLAAYQCPPQIQP